MIGQTLSHYRILSPLGRGAMGEVFAAEDVRLGRRVAVKLLPAELGTDPAATERFTREARIISSLNHPNICTLYDIGEHQGRHFMVMELLEGEPLAARLARGPLPIDQVLTFGSDIAGALDAAHRQGAVHRDIKPANLFVTTQEHIKVLDFGVAKLTDARSAADATSAGTNQLTGVGAAIGTVAYMSPEQARGQDIDARSDLFSLGVVLYEMATGASPFPGTTPATIFEGILTKTPPPPSTVRAGLPGDLDRVVGRALEKDPALRHQSAADLRAELKRLQKETAQVPGATASLPVAPPARNRRSWWWLAAPVATAVVIAAVLGWQSTRTPALASRDLVVLATLTNRTGDAMFDGTLGEALAVQLRQSPFLNVVPDQRVQATLRMMQRDPMQPITDEVGRDVCQRVGARALLTSAIAALGSSYVITLRAQDCVTGDALAERQVQAERKEDVLRELGGATTLFREQLGESLASIKRYDAQVEMATTPSLEALKAYSQALSARRTIDDRAALPLMRRAVELDPTFALAHARLGTIYANLLDTEASRRHATRAFELRDKVSELERLYIEARYYTTGQADPAKAIEAYRVSIGTYPTDYASRTNLAILLKERGELEESLALLREATRLAPEEPSARFNLAGGLLEIGQFDEARAEIDRLLAVRDNGASRALLMSLAVLRGDAALEAQQREWAKGHDDPTDTLPMQLGAALYRGQFREAERLVGELQRVYNTAGVPTASAGQHAGTATNLAMAGAADRARALMARLPGDGSADQTADERLVTAALIGDRAAAARALPIALENARADSESTTVLLRTMGRLAAGDLAGAIATLGDVQYNRGDADYVLVHGMMARRAEQWEVAIRDLTWYGDNLRRQLSANRAVAMVELARAYEGAGRRDDARAAYAAFLEFWKTADDDLPIVVDAKRALARLSS